VIADLKEFLEGKVALYNRASFLDEDPIAIPHRFHKRQDIEIAGFLTATLAWGNRKAILNSADKLMRGMEYDPHQFILHHEKQDLAVLQKFVHRTFNSQDLFYFIKALRHLYKYGGGLERAMAPRSQESKMAAALLRFREEFFSLPHRERTEKHVSNPARNSACKRLHMFLRWMVRRDKAGIDFGLWRQVSPAQLSIPLDVHSGRVARALGLLQRQADDGKAVVELDTALRQMDPLDPVKYDYALFGLGAFEGWAGKAKS